jgi:hypothetical protein
MNIAQSPAVEVKTESTVWGSMVAVHSRRLYLSAPEAEELAHSLIIAAAKLRDAETRPMTRPLPLTEPTSLAELSAALRPLAS